jgi:pimeloyl-ACP methyl ester carboxylesterase
MFFRILLSATALITALAASPPSSLTGHWAGTLHRGTAQLSVSFDFPPDAEGKGFFSAPKLSAIDVPLSNVRSGGVPHWEIVGDTYATKFDGVQSGDSIIGTFSEPPGNGTFVLRRVSTSTAKPYTQEPVTFMNGNARLSGTVFAPVAAGKHPAIVFLHGSGPEGRWANAYLADYVARHGVVALVYDKRGVGTSTGDWRTSTMQDLANDGRAAVNALAQRTDVDSNNIGVYGHSQGGELAPTVAQYNDRVAFVIAADSFTGPQFHQDLYRVDTMLATMYSGRELTDAKALYAEFVDVARTGAPHAKLRADIRAANNAPWLADLAIPDDSNWIWNWYEGVADFDATPAWQSVRVPVLLLYGADDALLSPPANIASITAILKANGNPPVTVRVFPHADHSMRVAPATPGGWPQNAEGFPDILATFANSPRTR